MARRGKEALIQVVLTALVQAGWTVDRLTERGVHPARFVASRGAERRTVRLYIWNMSHGGKTRADQEFRIQITGVEGLEPEPDGVTLLMGWDDDFGVFAGFDASARRRTLGASPSIQISQAALEKAALAGGALHRKRDGEIAVGVRPDRLGRYIIDLRRIHAGDLSPLLGEAPEAEDDVQIRLAGLAEPGATFDFSRPGDAKLRAEVRAKAEALLSALEPNPVPPGQIGHNRPPEPIDDDDDLPETLVGAAQYIREQTTSEAPDGVRLAKTGGILAWAARLLEGVRAEGRKFVEKGKDLLREHAAKAIGGLIGGALVTAREQIIALLQSLVQVLLKWLELAAGLF